MTCVSCSAFSSARRSIRSCSAEPDDDGQQHRREQRQHDELAEQGQARRHCTSHRPERAAALRPGALDGRTLDAVPEGDTIHYAANRIRPVLAGHVPDELRTPHPRFGRARWEERLDGPRGRGGRGARQAPLPAVRGRSDDPLAPAHDRLVARARPRRAVAALAPRGLAPRPARRPRGRAVQRSRPRADDGVARALRPPAGRSSGPTSSRPEFDEPRFLRRLREDDPTRPIGDSLLDQRTIAGIGNLWKVEGCFDGEDRSLAARRGGERRRGPRDHRGDAAADAALGAGRQPDPLQADLRQGRAAVPALRRDDPRARAVGRQPADLLVPGVSGVTVRRVGHKGADHIAPGNTLASFDAALAAQRRHDRVRRPPRGPGRPRGEPAAARPRLRAPGRARAHPRAGPRAPRRGRVPARRARRGPQAARLRGAGARRRCAPTASRTGRSSPRCSCAA